MKRNLLKKVVLAGSLVSVLASCGGNASLDMSKWTFSPKNASNIQIGILQPLEHEALSLARNGFVDELKTNGYEDGKNITVNYQNAQGVEADLTTLAKTLTSKCDLTLGIGTGASQALHAAEINAGSTNPILFTAVTDPVSAELIESMEAPGGYLTGTSDANPVEAQISLIKECRPEAKTLGIIYTQSETNSEVQANQAKKAAEAAGLKVVIETCTDSSDISTVVLDLCGNQKVDALYVPTDNNVAANMSAVKPTVDKYGVLTVCGEESTMNVGGHVTLSVSYYDLGVQTAKMAVEILKGNKKPCDIACTTMPIEACSYLMNSKNLADAAITLSDTVKAKFKDTSAN